MLHPNSPSVPGSRSSTDTSVTLPRSPAGPKSNVRPITETSTVPAPAGPRTNVTDRSGASCAYSAITTREISTPASECGCQRTRASRTKGV